MTDKAKLGFIGLGTMGKDLLQQTMENPRAEVVALCDIEPKALDAAMELAGAGPSPYTDYHDLLRAGGLDGVVVAAPQDWHASIGIDALDAGVNVFCEKPMALNVGQCDAMIAAAQRNGKGLMIGQVLRYIGVSRYVLERVREGDLGKPFAVRIIRTMGQWGNWARPWRFSKEQSGGLLLEINAHEIDYLRCLLGEAKFVSAMGGHFINDEIDYEDFITAHIGFENEGIGSLTSNSCDYLGKYTGEVYCEGGTIYYDSVSQCVRVMREGAEKEKLPYAEIHPEWENGVYREIREFAEACLGEGPITIPGEEGLRNVEIGEACYRSIEEGRPIALPLSRSGE